MDRRIYAMLTVFSLGLFTGSFAGYAQPLKQVDIGVPTNSSAWFPLYVAMKKNAFHEAGFRLRPIVMDARVAVAALVSKEVPYIAQMGSAISGAGQGLPIKIVMAFAAKTHHVLVTSRDISSPQDLRGRRVGISRPGATPHRELLAVLEKYKIEPSQVTVLGLGPDQNRMLALERGQVDAIVTGVPYNLLLEPKGFKTLLYIKDVIDMPLSALTTHDDWIREKRDEVRAFIASALKATAYVKTHRSEVLPLLQEFIGLPDQAMAALAYDALRDVWPDDGLTSSQGLTNAISLAGLPASTPLSRVVDWSIVKEAAAQIKR